MAAICSPRGTYIICMYGASIEHYSNEPTDTASSGTIYSFKLKEALCNSQCRRKIRSASKLMCGSQEKMNKQDSRVEVVYGVCKQFYPSYRCLLLRALASEATLAVR